MGLLPTSYGHVSGQSCRSRNSPATLIGRSVTPAGGHTPQGPRGPSVPIEEAAAEFGWDLDGPIYDSEFELETTT
jgi:hypothetical protein